MAANTSTCGADSAAAWPSFMDGWPQWSCIPEWRRLCASGRCPTRRRWSPCRHASRRRCPRAFGWRLSSGVMTTLSWLKISVLAALVGWAVFSGHAALANLAPLTVRRAGSDPLGGAIAGAAISAFFCFGGWWEAGKIAGEVRNPRRTLPIAFSGGVIVVTILYLLVGFAFVAVVPM